MSVISSNHSVDHFTSGKSVAIDATQRLAKITFKTMLVKDAAGKVVLDTAGKPKTTKRDSKCVSIPAVTSLGTNEITGLMPYVIAMYQDAQDDIIRDMVIAGLTSVNDENISYASVCEYLEAVAKGDRLTKDAAVAWFNADNGLADSLRVVFADKLGLSDNPTDEQVKKVEQSVNGYRDLITALAGGKTQYAVELSGKLHKVVEKYCDLENDAIASRFATRLHKMATTKVVELADAL